MQEVFYCLPYDRDVRHKAKTSPENSARLKALRTTAGLSVRELARQIGEQHTNVLFWEKTGRLPRSDVLVPMAKSLGVTVEELLGETKPKRISSPAGKARLLFEAVSKLPRRQQEKIFSILEPFVFQHSNGQKQAA